MPNIKSAKKRVKLAEQNRLRNVAIKSTIRTFLKATLKAFEESNMELFAEKQSLLYSKLDKAAKLKVYHPNKIARIKSRLAKKTSTKTA